MNLFPKNTSSILYTLEKTTENSVQERRARMLMLFKKIKKFFQILLGCNIA